MQLLKLDEGSLARTLWPGLQHHVKTRIEEHIKTEVNKLISKYVYDILKDIVITESREYDGKYVFTMEVPDFLEGRL